jgi:hypothetical protein
VIRRGSKTFPPDKVKGPGKSSNHFGMPLLSHLPDGRLADEDQEDEKPSQHVQAADKSKCQLEKTQK